jgi:hypothetical protein
MTGLSALRKGNAAEVVRAETLAPDSPAGQAAYDGLKHQAIDLGDPGREVVFGWSVFRFEGIGATLSAYDLLHFLRRSSSQLAGKALCLGL